MDKLWWGVMIILLDISIFGVDILPNIVGIILIYIALTELEGYNEDFINAKSLSVIVGIIILLRVVFRSSLLFLTIEVIVTIPMIYFILYGVSALVLRCGNNNISEKLLIYFRTYVVIKICVIVLRLFRSGFMLSMAELGINVVVILIGLIFYKAKELVK